MAGLTEKQKEKICKNLHAFTHWFGEPRIERDPYRKVAFMVYLPADSETWIQYCESIDYLNGWLYGCVQAHVREEFKKGAKQ